MVLREQHNRAECGYLDQFPVRICKWLPYLNINLPKIIIGECCARLYSIIKFEEEKKKKKQKKKNVFDPFKWMQTQSAH